MLWAGVDGSGAVYVYDARETKIDQMTPAEARIFARNMLLLADVVEGLNDAPDHNRPRDQDERD